MKKYQKHKKILPSHHSGRVVHHRHTSYGGLALLMLMAVLILSVASQDVSQAAASDPVTASHSTHAVVPGAVPGSAPEIRTVQPGTLFTSGDPITVGGICPEGTLIKVFKNEVFGGASLCNDGNFSMEVDLFIGSNSLIARAYNANNVSGPESAPIVVTRRLSEAELTTFQAASEFFITSDVYYKGINVGEKLTWPVTISGGQAPYAVSVGWGDGKTDLISRKEAGAFEVSHVYAEAGEGTQPHRNITITATDQTGEQSFVQLVTVVNGVPGVISGVKQGYNLSGVIRTAWQLSAGILITIISFWLGERWEARILKRSASRA